MVDALLGAAQLNINPGAVQSANCPELTWQAAKWWQDFYSGGGTDPLSGFYHAPHRLP
jgi:hypothetical protein